MATELHQMQVRHDTAANWTSTNPVLLLGEQGLETDTRKTKFGDGTTAWASLPYASGTDATTGAKGIIQLAGDLGGSAGSPTVPGLTGKVATTRAITAGTGLSGGGDLSADRTLAVSYGTTSGTAAQGNDSRITGALQAANNLSDVTPATARGNLGAEQGLTPTAVKTSAYSAAGGDLVPVDTTSGAVTITLPTAPANLTRIAVKHIIQGGTNAVTIALGGSDVFNKAGGSTTGTLALLNQSMVFQYQATGAIWTVTATDLQLSQLDLRFARVRSVVSKTTAYTAVSGDIVLASASGGAYAVTLPAVASGALVTVKKTDSTTNAITITPGSGTIDGATSIALGDQYASRDVVSDGTNWFQV